MYEEKREETKKKKKELLEIGKISKKQSTIDSIDNLSRSNLTGDKNKLLLLKKKDQVPLSGKLYVRIVKAQNLPPADNSGTSDPYVICNMTHQCSTKWEFDSFYQFKTSVIKKNLNPEWKDGPNCFILQKEGDLIFNVYDHNKLGKDVVIAVGKLKINSREHLKEQGWIFPITLDVKLSDEEIEKNSKKSSKKNKKNKKKKGSKSKIAKLWVELRFESYNVQTSHAAYEIEQLEFGKPVYKIFSGDLHELVFQQSCSWMNQAKQCGIQIMDMKYGTTKTDNFFVGIWYQRIEHTHENYGFLFNQNLI
ncbi:c2 domain-containing protein [Anaeramoeba flamelloides]|uniref:C2 domain-containing protein n=1 Tax=Anaeramoeba flamelloides TaxID=1746091 RepID=A0AAV7Z0R0_9EUKA|nr:c2 domain-containing protein [Anaeramoeba flamelloides]